MIEIKDSYCGSVYGGLGALLYCFCESENIAIPEKILNIQQLERFDYSLWLEILTELDQQLQIPALGLKIAEYVQPKHLGIIGYLSPSCQTLGEALQRYHDFHRLMYDGSPLLINLENNQLVVRWDVPEIFTTQLSNEIAIALTYNFLRQFIHTDNIHINAIHFSHARTGHAPLYEQHFGCKVLFSQRLTQIYFPISIMNQPILHADATLQNLLITQAKLLLEDLPHSTLFDERLQQAILKGLQNHSFRIDDIAKELKLSTRQLQRHLQQQNTTFQQSLQAIRLLMAEQYLRDQHLGLHEISLLLGYSEQSAFQRAFKLWTNMTPQFWRKQYAESVIK